MRILLQVARDLLIVVVLALVAVVFYDVHRSLRDTAGQARYTLDNANRLIRELAQTSANARHATAEWEAASRQQAAYFTQAAAKTNADLDAIHTLVVNTDAQINGGVLPELSNTLKSQNESLDAFTSQARTSLAELSGTVDALRPAIANTAAATANVAQLTADPSIAQSLRNLDRTSAATADAVESLDRQINMIEPVTKKVTTPPSKAAFIFNTAVDLAAKFGSMFAGFAK